MAGVARTNLTTIMLAAEQMLLGFVTVTGSPVCGDISNIYWLMSGDTPVKPGTTGQRDVLLVERNDDTRGNFRGGGRIGTMLYSGLDVYLRSSYAVDRMRTRKQWLIAHATLIDGLKDALYGFFPTDSAGNALTVEGFIPDLAAAPVKARDAELWGYTIATYRFHYLPNIQANSLPASNP